MKAFKGEVDIGGVKYPVEVKNGERFINGISVDEFIKTISPKQMLQAARVGAMALKDEIDEVKPPKGKYQYFINEPL